MVTLSVVMLILMPLSSTLVLIFRHSLPICTDTRILMSISIGAHVYQTFVLGCISSTTIDMLVSTNVHSNVNVSTSMQLLIVLTPT